MLIIKGNKCQQKIDFFPQLKFFFTIFLAEKVIKHMPNTFRAIKTQKNRSTCDL